MQRVYNSLILIHAFHFAQKKQQQHIIQIIHVWIYAFIFLCQAFGLENIANFCTFLINKCCCFFSSSSANNNETSGSDGK